MKLRQLHSWDVTPEEAARIQRELASQVSLKNEMVESPKTVAGLDISAEDAQGTVRAAVVALSLPGLEVLEVQVASGRPPFPYIPGLLAFREAPVGVAALERLVSTPDLIVVDGQGLAHPRRFGIACHIGLLAGVPTIGCAKSILRGRHGPLGTQRGAVAELVDGGEVVGAALRTKEATSPVYISVGHKVDLDTAVRWSLACCRGHRLPEPTRLAHLAAGGWLKETGPERPTHAQKVLF